MYCASGLGDETAAEANEAAEEAYNEKFAFATTAVDLKDYADRASCVETETAAAPR